MRAMIAAATVSAVSIATTTNRRERWDGTRSAMRPPPTAPARKSPRAHRLAVTEKPAAPASANPIRATLPVMLAVKTWPSPRKLTASTMPLTTVSVARVTTRGWGG